MKITKRQLQGIIAESINRALNENKNVELFNAIDNAVSELGDVYVSRFYSDDEHITIAVNIQDSDMAKDRIIEIMNGFGYNFYDSGSNGEYIMLEFENDGLNER